MDKLLNEDYDYLANSPLGLQIPAGLNLGDQYSYLKRNIYRTVALRNLSYIAEFDAFYFFDAHYDEVWHVWPADTPVEQIVSELEQNGWKCSEVGEDAIEIDCTNPEGEEILFQMFSEFFSIRRKSFRMDRYFVPELPYMFEPNPSPELPDAEFGYIRFGDIPADGYSMNELLGVPEKGVSCFNAEITANGDYQFTQMTPVLCEDAMMFFEENDRPLYRLYGEFLGHGWDGEPLLKVSKAERISGNYIGKPLEAIREKALRDIFLFDY